MKITGRRPRGDRWREGRLKRDLVVLPDFLDRMLVAGLRAPVRGAHHMDPADRAVAGGRGRLVGLGAGEGLPEAIDRLVEAGDLLGQPLVFGLLGGEL